MTSGSKKKQTISDEINNILKPKELTEENEEIEATFDDFNEFRDKEEKKISEIRKQNAKQLSDLSSKYKGKAVSRKELEAENGDVSESESDEQSSENESEDEDPEVSENSEEGSDTDDDDEDTDDEYGDFDLAQFAKPQQVSKEEDSAVLVKDSSSSKNDDIQKGICVQNQLKMWEKLLEVRIKAQKMLITANSLPDYDAFLDLSERDEDSLFMEKVDSTCDNVYNLMDNLLELQTTLVGK
jgi:protein AATF/BFR2